MQNTYNTACAALRDAGVPVAQDVPLAPYTSFQIGGPAAVFAQPQSPQQIAAAFQVARECRLPAMLLGKGSNVLFLDDGYPGIVVHIGEGLAGIAIEGSTITAGAGAKLMDVCTAARDAGLSGLEFAFGIPGSVGGAVYMNAGAYGGEMCDVLQSVSYLDETGAVQTAIAGELGLGYRSSVFQQKGWCVLSATMELKPGNKEQIAAEMRDIMARRADKQPLEYPSAGSAFKRPPGQFAGALIDQCGLRGHQIGGAAISQKHCGFIVNLGGATCADVLALADHIVQTVEAQTGHRLEKEIRVIKAGEHA